MLVAALHSPVGTPVPAGQFSAFQLELVGARPPWGAGVVVEPPCPPVAVAVLASGWFVEQAALSAKRIDVAACSNRIEELRMCSDCLVVVRGRRLSRKRASRCRPGSVRPNQQSREGR